MGSIATAPTTQEPVSPFFYKTGVVRMREQKPNIVSPYAPDQPITFSHGGPRCTGTPNPSLLAFKLILSNIRLIPAARLKISHLLTVEEMGQPHSIVTAVTNSKKIKLIFLNA